MEDFEEALKEVKPAFGAVTETLEAYRLNGIIDYGEHCRHLLSVCKQLVEQASSLQAVSGSVSRSAAPSPLAVMGRVLPKR